MDTLKIYERLRKADLSEPVALELTKSFSDLSKSHFSSESCNDRMDVCVKSVVDNSGKELLKWIGAMLIIQIFLFIVIIRLL